MRIGFCDHSCSSTNRFRSPRNSTQESQKSLCGPPATSFDQSADSFFSCRTTLGISLAQLRLSQRTRRRLDRSVGVLAGGFQPTLARRHAELKYIGAQRRFAPPPLTHLHLGRSAHRRPTPLFRPLRKFRCPTHISRLAAIASIYLGLSRPTQVPRTNRLKWRTSECHCLGVTGVPTGQFCEASLPARV